jgi:hypothetical protein
LGLVLLLESLIDPVWICKGILNSPVCQSTSV